MVSGNFVLNYYEQGIYTVKSCNVQRADDEHPDSDLVDNTIVPRRIKKIQADLFPVLAVAQDNVSGRRTSSETLRPNITYPAAPMRPYSSVAIN